MANEVYQFKVNNEAIKLGKGSNTDDEFASFKDVGLYAIVGFMYLPVQIQGQSLMLIIPATKDFKEGWEAALYSKGPTHTSPWPIISICSYQDQPISTNTKYYGLVSPSKILIQQDLTVSEVPYVQNGTVQFIWFR